MTQFCHIPIMLDEVLGLLAPERGGIFVDGTLGGGGHSEGILKRLAAGRLYGIDRDGEAIAAAGERLKPFGDRFKAIRGNFFDMKSLLAGEGVTGADGILLDLGVSSYQLDTPERGFSYKAEGPLDLRLNSQAGISAAQRLKELDKESLAGMLVENADEPYAEEIARQIYNTLHKKKKPIETTTALHEQIVEALSKVKLSPDEDRKMVIKKSSARVFQALRIDVNHEYEVLYEFMEKLPEALRTGGRAAILTFHSGEDRIVKKAFQAFHRAGVYSDIAKEVIKPSREECFRNSRAHSTKLRWAVKA